jgi:hypothetical protein
MHDQPWLDDDTVELEWQFFEALGPQAAADIMNRISKHGGKAMSVHFVGLGHAVTVTSIPNSQKNVVPIFNIFALMPKVQKRD